ncbi:MAG: leucine-rich repeat domain-containing protein [Flavobacteriales bacterium]
MIRPLLPSLVLLILSCWGAEATAQSVDWQAAPVYMSIESAQTARAAGQPVYRIDLTKKRLRSLPAELTEWTELREIILDRNKLTRIDEDLSSWAFLERFSAVSNALEAFPASAIAWTGLKELDLGDNAIDSIPLDIDQLSELRTLSLWSNVIAHYPASLGDLRKLKTLDLEYNDMTLEEQELLKSWLPLSVSINLSAPCRCDFDE